MSLSAVIQALDLLDAATVNGQVVADAIRAAGVPEVEVQRFTGQKGSTDFLRITVPGTHGQLAGGQASTLGIVGRLGGIGARPEKVGLVFDAEQGALLDADDGDVVVERRDEEEPRGHLEGLALRLQRHLHQPQHGEERHQQEDERLAAEQRRPQTAPAPRGGVTRHRRELPRCRR